MGPLVIATVCLAAAVQKPLPDNAKYPDVPDNHFVYGMLSELKSDGLLPELDADVLLLERRPLTRGQIGRYVVQATMNLQRYVDEHRQVASSGMTVKYSETLTDFSADQLRYL